MLKWDGILDVKTMKWDGIFYVETIYVEMIGILDIETIYVEMGRNIGCRDYIC